jgi:hypothetical protein
MQRLLEAPKPHIPTSVDPEPTQMTEENEEEEVSYDAKRTRG